MALREMNETDVREEIAMPLLDLLGYKRGTSADIHREHSLRYEKLFLGRKKKEDPPLRGRADYMLSVAGCARWVLEIKSPAQDIDVDAVEQALSYARHPEVSGVYAALLNGRRFVLYNSAQSSDAGPVLDLMVESVEGLADKLQGTLAPAAIRRDWKPRPVDTGKPVAEGYRSEVDIVGGEIRYDDYSWQASMELAEGEAQNLNAPCSFMTGYVANVVGGRIWRGEEGRLRAVIAWAFPRDELRQFDQEKGISEFEYVSLSDQVSADATCPTLFEIIGDVTISQGEAVYDVRHWKSTFVGQSVVMTVRGQASGHLADDAFCGRFLSRIDLTFPAVPGLTMSFFGEGTFRVKLDDR